MQAKELEKYDQARASVFYYKTDVSSSLIANLLNKRQQIASITSEQITKLFGHAVDIELLYNKGTFHSIYLISEVISDNQKSQKILRVNVSDDKDYSLLLDHCLTNFISNKFQYAAILVNEQGSTREDLSSTRATLDRDDRVVAVVKSHCCDLSRNTLNLDYQLIALADGKELTSVRETDSYPELLTNLGNELRKIHTICGEGYGLVSLKELYNNKKLQGLHRTWYQYFNLNLHKHIDFCFDKGYINMNEHKDIYNLFSSNKELIDSQNTSLLHCDLGDHNIFTLSNNITAILDWEDAVLGEPIYDIALWATFHPEQDYQYFLKGYYGGLDNLPENFWSRFWLYYLRVAIAKTVHRHKFGYQDKSGAMPASTRIQKAITKLDEILNGVIVD